MQFRTDIIVRCKLRIVPTSYALEHYCIAILQLIIFGLPLPLEQAQIAPPRDFAVVHLVSTPIDNRVEFVAVAERGFSGPHDPQLGVDRNLKE